MPEVETEFHDIAVLALQSVKPEQALEALAVMGLDPATGVQGEASHASAQVPVLCLARPALHAWGTEGLGGGGEDERIVGLDVRRVESASVEVALRDSRQASCDPRRGKGRLGVEGGERRGGEAIWKMCLKSIPSRDSI